MTLTLTAEELALLRELVDDVAWLICSPRWATGHWSAGDCGGGNPSSCADPHSGFRYKYTATRLEGQWYTRRVAATSPCILADARVAGQPSRYHHDDPYLHVRITYRRLTQWATSLPEPIRYRAAHHHAGKRGTSRDLCAVARDALALTPGPTTAPGQLSLF